MQRTLVAGVTGKLRGSCAHSGGILDYGGLLVSRRSRFGLDALAVEILVVSRRYQGALTLRYGFRYFFARAWRGVYIDVD